MSEHRKGEKPDRQPPMTRAVGCAAYRFFHRPAQAHGTRALSALGSRIEQEHHEKERIDPGRSQQTDNLGAGSLA